MLSSVFVDSQISVFLFGASHALSHPGCSREKSKAPARICSPRQAFGHECEEAHFPHRGRNEIGMARCVRLLAWIDCITQSLHGEFYFAQRPQAQRLRSAARWLRAKTARGRTGEGGGMVCSSQRDARSSSLQRRWRLVMDIKHGGKWRCSSNSRPQRSDRKRQSSIDCDQVGDAQ